MRLLLKMAWRNLWRSSRRTVLTASSMALGLALLLVFLGLGDGSHHQMIDAAVRLGSGHVVVQARGYQERRSVELTVGASTVAAVEEWASGALDGASRIGLPVRRVFGSGLLSSADGSSGVRVVGVEPDREATCSLFASKLTSGVFLKEGDLRGALLGQGLSRKLKARLGSRLVVMAQPAESTEFSSMMLRVRGVLRTGVDAFDESLLMTTLPAAQSLYGLADRVHQVAVILEHESLSGAWASNAREALPGVDVLSWDQADTEMARYVELDDAGNYLYNGIFFLVIAFMIFNTLLMSVLERRREFALLQALGVTPVAMFCLVMFEGVILALLGILAGLALGWPGHLYFKIYGLPLSVFTEQEFSVAGVVMDPILRSELSAGRVAGSMLVLLTLTCCLAIIPAWKAAARMDPKVLRS